MTPVSPAEFDALQQRVRELQARLDHAECQLASAGIAAGLPTAASPGTPAPGAAAAVQKSLRHSEEYFRAIIENATDVISVLNADGTIRYESPAARRILGYEPESMQGRSAFEFLHPDDQERVRAVFVSGVGTPGTVATEELRFRHADGSWRVLQVVGQNLVGNPAVNGLVLNSRDITDQREALEALHESERKFALFMQYLLGHAWVAGADRRLVFANRRLADSLGVEPGALLGKRLEDVVRMSREDADIIRRHDEQVLTQRQAIVCEETVHRPGDNRTSLVSKFPIPLDGGGVRLGVLSIDITDRTRAATERKAYEAHAQHQQKLESLGILAGGVAHEINNPINGIMNYAQLIFDGMPEGGALRQYAEEIIGEAKRIARIVTNLLMFARQDHQAHSLASIQEIVDGTLTLVKTVLRHDRIALDVQIVPNLPEVRCRPQQIQQVILNLMTNARDAINQRYPGCDAAKRVGLTVGLVRVAGRRYIRATVEDHGSGIPDEIRERVFDPFFTTKPKEIGTGLGLSISHGIARDHGGRLHFETEVGKGTRFHLDLPLE